MISIIRIKGQTGIRRDAEETLNRLRLMKKYTCVVIAKPTPVQNGMLQKVKDFVAYGDIDEKTFAQLIEKRAQLIDKTKKTDLKKAAESLIKGGDYESLNIKPFFRLHPPRKGIDSKKHFGVDKGVLGNNKGEINKLIERML